MLKTLEMLGKAKDLLVKLFAFINGRKTYLVGLAMTFEGAAGLLRKVSELTDLAGLMSLLSTGANDPAMQMFLAGLAILAGRHAISKVEGAVAPVAAAIAPDSDDVAKR